MKIFIIFAFIVIVSAVNAAKDIKEQEQLLNEHIKKCREEFAITDEELVELKKGAITDGTESVRCFINCFFEESAILKDGIIQDEKANKAFSLRVGEEKAKEALEGCRAESGPAKCETALKFHNCIHGYGVF